jgi:hypothetical protein
MTDFVEASFSARRAAVKEATPEPSERIRICDRELSREILRRLTAAGTSADEDYVDDSDCVQRRVVAFWKWLGSTFPLVRTHRCVIDYGNALIPVLTFYERLPEFPEGTIQIDRPGDDIAPFWTKFSAFSRSHSPLDRFALWYWAEKRYPQFKDSGCSFIFDPRGVFIIPRPDTEDQRRWKEESRRLSASLLPTLEGIEESLTPQRKTDPHPSPQVTPQDPITGEGRECTGDISLIPQESMASRRVAELLRLLDFFISGQARILNDYFLRGDPPHCVMIAQGKAMIRIDFVPGDGIRLGVTGIYGTDSMYARANHPVVKVLVSMLDVLLAHKDTL